MATRAALPPGCPLHVRSNGQWGKRIRGRIATFGSVLEVDLREALRRYHDFESAVHAGRSPRPVDERRLTVRAVFERYAEDLHDRVEAGTLAAKTLDGHARHLREVAKAIGPEVAVEDLGPGDFLRARRAIERVGWGPTTIGNAITSVRGAFAWAVDTADLLQHPPRYGAGFRKPRRSEVRRARAARGIDGKILLPVETIRACIDRARPVHRAAILLGINGGLGNAEVAALDRREIRGDLVRTTRPKTGIERVVPLWPETEAALKVAESATRGVHRDPAAIDAALVTRNGRRLVRRSLLVRDGRPRVTETNAIGQAFARLLAAVDPVAAAAPGVGFYALRHTFATIASETRDRLAIARVMGHATDGAVDDGYVERIGEERLRAVVEHVRVRVLVEGATPSEATSESEDRASGGAPPR